MRYRFGDFVLDGEARSLSRGGEMLVVSPKAFDLLSALLEHRPTVVSKERLRDQLWPQTFVSHTSLARLVTELRKTLQDARQQPRFLRTVHGFGYAFCGQVSDPAEAPMPSGEGWVVLWGGREFGLSEGENVIGRGSGCAVRVRLPKVSRRHALIRVAEGQAVLEDLGSKNGTFRAGEKMAGPSPLADGDEICVGSALLVIYWRHAGSTPTA